MSQLPVKSQGNKVVASSSSAGAGGHDPAVGVIERGPAGIMSIGWLVIIIGLGGFFGWAALAPLDSGVTAPGVVVVDSERQKVQHLDGGIVEEILVRDGDVVEEGDVLFRLDRTNPRAELAIVRSRLFAALAVEARLRAERERAEAVQFPEELLAEAVPSIVEGLQELRVDALVDTQRRLFEIRRDGLRNELSILDEKAQGLREQVEGLEAQRRGKERQITLLKEELSSMQVLFEEGYVPRTRIFELERALADVQAGLSEDIAALGQARSALAEVRLQQVQLEQTFLREVDAELSQVQSEVDELRERRFALQAQLDRLDIVAPVAGVVVNRQVHSVGGVIRPGEDLLELVPEGDPLVIEARVPVQSIELVYVGLSALVRFSALDVKNPMVDGELVHVSADRLVDESTGEPYFNARVEVPPEELARLNYEKIVPGMPAEVVIRTGERTVLDYLMKPVNDALFSAFRER
ncbi:MAG: HlyD family type I secretion periplasmic adaptor subunit [Halothiobacillaceae bacterium]